jgi:tRNA(Ile2) C34 agmatinyltransferase TiaS
MVRIVIDQTILEKWLKAKIKLHSDKLTPKEERLVRDKERINPCQYCTDFLTERGDGEDDYKCVKCGIRDVENDFFSAEPRKKIMMIRG